MAGTIHRLDGDGIDQRATGSQLLNCRQTVINGIFPVTGSVQGDSTILAGIVTTDKLLITTVIIGDG